MTKIADLEANPWEVLSTKQIHQNPWFSVDENQVLRPDGNPGQYFVVQTRIATGVVALTEDRQVYLVGQFRFPTNTYSWEIVEGGAEPGESAEAAARRELAEEAGLVARSWRRLGGDIQLSNCISSEMGYLYLAEELELTLVNPDPTEILQLKKLPLAECLKLIEDGVIQDALSIIALLRVARLLGA